MLCLWLDCLGQPSLTEQSRVGSELDKVSKFMPRLSNVSKQLLVMCLDVSSTCFIRCLTFHIRVSNVFEEVGTTTRNSDETPQTFFFKLSIYIYIYIYGEPSRIISSSSITVSWILGTSQFLKWQSSSVVRKVFLSLKWPYIWTQSPSQGAIGYETLLPVKRLWYHVPDAIVNK